MMAAYQDRPGSDVQRVWAYAAACSVSSDAGQHLGVSVNPCKASRH